MRDIYKCIGNVMEIDPFYFPGFDHSCMRFVTELQHPRIPSHVGVHHPSGHGIVLWQSGLAFWSHEQQFDAVGD